MEQEFDKAVVDRDKQYEYDAIQPIGFPELKETIDKWMLITDQGVIKLLLATLFANLIPSDPVWLFLIAESAGGKTELMNGLLKIPTTYSLSRLTPNTFLSGYKAKERPASLLHRLNNGTTLLFKDFTSMLDGNKDDLKDIMGQFRDIYDGFASREYGTGMTIEWKGKLGFIAGCTPIIEQRMSTVGAMGERFLSYRMKQPTRAKLREKMRQNIGKESQMREEIATAFAAAFKGLAVPPEMPTLSQDVTNMIEGLADFISLARAVVMRSLDSKRDIEWIAPPEMSGRVYKQLYTIALSLWIINGNTWTEDDSYILRNMAISSIHSLRFGLIKTISAFKTQVKTSTLALEMGYPTSTIRRYLEDLAAITMDDRSIRILNRVHQGKGKTDLWQLDASMNSILNLMGETNEAVREDSNLDSDEEDVAVGTKVVMTEAEAVAKVDDITKGMSQEELINFGII